MRKLVYVLLFLLLGSGVGRAQVIDYLQCFPGNGSSGSVSLSSYHWYGFYGNSTTNAQQASFSTTPGAQVSNGGGASASGQTNVNATAGGSLYNIGVAFFNTSIPTDQYVLGTGEYPIARNGGATDPADFTWQAAGNAGDTQRLAIELSNGQWYVSTNVLTISTSIPSGSAMNFKAPYTQTDFTAFSTAASSWQMLNFSTTGTSTLSIGGTLSSPLPSLDIMQFGVYLTDGSNSGVTDHNFIDNFEVDSTPEPTTGMLLLSPLALLHRRRRR